VRGLLTASAAHPFPFAVATSLTSTERHLNSPAPVENPQLRRHYPCDHGIPAHHGLMIRLADANEAKM
jgi:hypothetical protein